MKQKFCIECNEPMNGGRSDKKFCCEACRNAYNNGIIAQEDKAMNEILKKLRYNRRVLEQAAKIERPTVIELARMGLDFDHFTHTKKGDFGTIYCCFDYAYSLSDGLTVQVFAL